MEPDKGYESVVTSDKWGGGRGKWILNGTSIIRKQSYGSMTDISGQTFSSPNNFSRLQTDYEREVGF
jgi:hypothetical protein